MPHLACATSATRRSLSPLRRRGVGPCLGAAPSREAVRSTSAMPRRARGSGFARTRSHSARSAVRPPIFATSSESSARHFGVERRRPDAWRAPKTARAKAIARSSARPVASWWTATRQPPRPRAAVRPSSLVEGRRRDAGRDRSRRSRGRSRGRRRRARPEARTARARTPTPPAARTPGDERRRRRRATPPGRRHRTKPVVDRADPADAAGRTTTSTAHPIERRRSAWSRASVAVADDGDARDRVGASPPARARPVTATVSHVGHDPSLRRALRRGNAPCKWECRAGRAEGRAHVPA